MKGTQFFSKIFLLWLINVLHCKHYLVEVEAEGPKNTIQGQVINGTTGETEDINERPYFGIEKQKTGKSHAKASLSMKTSKNKT